MSHAAVADTSGQVLVTWQAGQFHTTHLHKDFSICSVTLTFLSAPVRPVVQTCFSQQVGKNPQIAQNGSHEREKRREKG